MRNLKKDMALYEIIFPEIMSSRDSTGNFNHKTLSGLLEQVKIPHTEERIAPQAILKIKRAIAIKNDFPKFVEEMSRLRFTRRLIAYHAINSYSVDGTNIKFNIANIEFYMANIDSASYMAAFSAIMDNYVGFQRHSGTFVKRDSIFADNGFISSWASEIKIYTNGIFSAKYTVITDRPGIFILKYEEVTKTEYNEYIRDSLNAFFDAAKFVLKQETDGFGNIEVYLSMSIINMVPTKKALKDAKIQQAHLQYEENEKEIVELNGRLANLYAEQNNLYKLLH